MNIIQTYFDIALFSLCNSFTCRKGQDTSITSVNSSGQDSGIAEAVRCPCGQSSMHTSEESSGYDAL